MTHPSPRQLPNARRAFTLLELLMSILIIGLLVGMLITAAVHVRRVVRETADRQVVINIGQAVGQFKKDFGFPPPLVRDQDANASPNRVVVAASGNRLARLNVYNPVVPADRLKLAAPTPPFDIANPCADNRFSTVTLAAYLVGAVATPISATPPPSGDPAPIDGVVGPGFYKPKRDGSFDVPGEVSNPSAAASDRSGRKGGRVEPMLALSNNLKLQPLTAPANVQGGVQVLDSRGVPIRYYLWERGDSTAPGGAYPVTGYASLNIPAIVGRWLPGASPPPDLVDPRNPGPVGLTSVLNLPPDRDVAANPKLRSASWAIVAAGRDGLFGDEPQAEILKVYTNLDLATARRKAESDNLVEVGE